MTSQILDIQATEDRALDDTPPYTALPLGSYFPSVPEVMEFESGWSELHNGVRMQRMMLILYQPASGITHIMTDDSKAPLRVLVYSRQHKDQPVPPWELFVGTTIDVLGRQTTLTRASQSTVDWLDAQAKRLWGLKMQLEAKLNKYLVKPKYVDVMGVPKSKLQHAKKTTVFGGTLNLHSLATAVMQLESELSQYM
eukprot:PhM_4_TR10717/c0_g2_i1/m.63780